MSGIDDIIHDEVHKGDPTTDPYAEIDADLETSARIEEDKEEGNPRTSDEFNNSDGPKEFEILDDDFDESQGHIH